MYAYFCCFCVQCATILILAFVAGVFYWRAHRVPTLTEKDTVLLTDFVNTTGDVVFDGVLKQALAIKLSESPFLNIFPGEILIYAMGRI